MNFKGLISIYVGSLLDILEHELGDHPRWPAIRSKVLKLFGNQGLTKDIEEKRGEKDHV